MTSLPLLKKIAIVTGGNLGDWALPAIAGANIRVGADRGALFLVRHGFRPELAVGDFDSVDAQQLEEIQNGCEQFISCDPIWKDLTDTEMAYEWALQQQPKEIIFVGALGTRFDHSLANVHLLRKGLKLGIACKIIDAHNEITVVDRELIIERGQADYDYTHVSILPLSMEVSGITLKGFQYPLADAVLSLGQSLGISNVLSEQRGFISITEGELLVIQSKD